MKTSITSDESEVIFNELRSANLAFQKIYPGDKPDRQPVHTVYGGANLFKSDTTKRMGDIALRNLKTYAPDFTVMAKVLKLHGHQQLPEGETEIKTLISLLDKMPADERKKNPAWLPYEVYRKVISKLEREAVEDFRINFEDGFGNRSDE